MEQTEASGTSETLPIKVSSEHERKKEREREWAAF